MRYIRVTKCKDGDKFDLNTPDHEYSEGCLIHRLPFESRVVPFLKRETTLYRCAECDKTAKRHITIVCKGDNDDYNT